MRDWVVVLCLSGLSSCCRESFQGEDVGLPCMVSEPVEDGLHELTVELRFDTLDLLRLHQASCSAEVVDGDIFIESDVTGVASCKEATSDPSEERIDCGVVVVPAGDVTAWFGAGERTFEVPTTTTQCVRPD